MLGTRARQLRQVVEVGMKHQAMTDFTRLMLATPVLAVLLNTAGIPLQTAAGFGMLVPMFMMNHMDFHDNND